MKFKSILLLIISAVSFSSVAFSHEWTVTLTTTKTIACNGDKGTVMVSWTELTAPVSIKLNGVEVGRDEQNGTGSFVVVNVPAGTNAFTVSEDPAISLPGTTPHSKTVYDTLVAPAAFALASKHIIEPRSGNADGSITLNITGGTSPYKMNWNTTPKQEGNKALNIPAGSYVLSLVDANACVFSHTEELKNAQTSSIDQLKVVKTMAYPNPVFGKEVYFDVPVKNLKALVYDISGKLLQEQSLTNNTLSLLGIPKGIYVINLLGAKAVVYQTKIFVGE